MRLSVLCILPAAVLISGCETESAPEPGPGQSWLCGREYENHAWGYQRRGVVLDMAGNIWKYDVRGAPGSSRWGPSDVTRLSEADLKMRYEGAMTVPGKRVPAAEIAKNFPLIADAAEERPTQPQSRGADMGQTLTYCYTFDAGTRSYSQVMLDNKGDWDSTNPSQAARNLVSWLNGWFAGVQ